MNSSEKAVLSDEETLVRAGRLVRRSAGESSDSELSRGRARLLRSIDERARDRRGTRPWVVALTICSAALVTVLVWFAWPRRVVEFSVQGTAVSEGGFVRAEAEPVRIAFDDGSAIRLDPHARLRISQQRERGASVHLEGGRMEVAVKPQEGGADYVFEAGPWAVKVVGTAFSLAWDPDRNEARIVMTEGEVRVIGPRVEDGFSLRAGQHMLLQLDEVRVSDGVRVTPEPTASATIATPLPSPSAEASPSTRASALLSLRGPTWAERVAAGDYEGVLADVDARGEEAVLGSGSIGDLMMLADAARYGGRPALGAAALRSVRSRFAGTKSAASAAFLLGRMAQDGGRAREAITLYEATIAEGSPFSSEALGRMMTIEHQQKSGRAKALAERYLASHPNGAYADVAKTILGTKAITPKEI